MKNVLVLIILTLFCSCGNRGTSLIVEGFSELPLDCREAGCSFMDKADENKFIMASGGDNVDYISLNGKVVGFKLVKSTPVIVNDSTTNYIETYKYDDYEMKLEMNQLHDGSEEDSFEGTITVKNKEGKTIVKKFIGGCSC